MAKTPKLLVMFPDMWYVSMGEEIKSGNGIWVCKAGGMATDLVELANECANFEREYTALTDGTNVVLPTSTKQAEAMLLVAQNYLDNNK
jgi:hypothetical protein